MLQALRPLLPRLSEYELHPEHFARGAFPCLAYIQPEPGALPTTAGDTHA